MRRARRPISLCLLLVAPLLLSHCASKESNTFGLRMLKPEESARLSSVYNPWYTRKTPDRQDIKLLPPERLESLGEIALQSQDYEGSLANFVQILEQDPERDDVRYKVGVILVLTGHPEAARKELAQVLARKPNMLEAHEAMGLVNLEEKQYPAAIQEFQTVLARDPKRAKTHHLLGLTYLESGQIPLAISQLKMAADLNSTQASTYINLGQAYLRQKDYTQAINSLKKGQSLAPQNKKVNYFLGMALAGQKRYNDALEAFLKAGDEAQAYNNIGVHYFVDGKYEEAAKCFQRAIELRPTYYGEAKANLQKALEKLQETQKDAS
jgi:tetratricopeptide (TPR) repeat protein